MIINIIVIAFVKYILIPKCKLWKCKVVCAYLWSLKSYSCLSSYTLLIWLIKIIYRFYILFRINWCKNIFSRFKIFCIRTILNFFYFIIHNWIYLYLTECSINILVKSLFNILKYAHWIIFLRYWFLRTINKIRCVL